MDDLTKSNSNYNPWNLEELKYNGRLYHYTGVKARKGIFGHVDCPDYPEDCISLRFTRIDCMTKNDRLERKHIDRAVKKIAKQLLYRQEISEDLLEIISEYKPTNKGVYRVKYEKDGPFLLEYGPVDPYVACFSINPNNEYIVNQFQSTVRITFNSSFSWLCADYSSHKIMQKNPATPAVVLYTYDYPMKCIRKCALVTYIRKVEYIDTSAEIDKIKSDLIEKKLLSIYEHYNIEKDKKIIEQDIEDMYFLCDAFIKDISFKHEEEVRFVIQLPQKDYFLKKYGKFPQWLADNHIVLDKDWRYLQLPISDDFVTL